MINSASSYHSPCGITLRQDQEAMFGFLPKEGFAFFAPPSDFGTIKNLLAQEKSRKFPVGYERLANGGLEPFAPNKAHYLGAPAYLWETLPLPESPLIINWMLTGNCNHKCAYCYAQDAMHNIETEPDENRIGQIIDSIRALRPVAVVITGGEPTLSPFFEDVIKEVANFASVVIDTNAANITESNVNIFAKHNVHIRISLDSHRPSKNLKTRIPIYKSQSAYYFDNIWKALIDLSKSEIPITINTVASTANYDDIINLSHEIRRFNVKKLRVRLVENSKSINDYRKLTGNDKRVNRFITYISERAVEDSATPIYLSVNRQRNSLVLVAPSGNFFTESQFVEQGKILIDPESPKHPRLEMMKKRVDMHAHSARYVFI